MGMTNKTLLFVCSALFLIAAGCDKQPRTDFKPSNIQQNTIPIIQSPNANVDIADNSTKFSSLYCHADSKIYYEGNTKEVTRTEGGVDLIIDFRNKTFSRTDNKGSDTYNAEFLTAGIYTNVQSTSPNGMMIKIQTEEVFPGNDPFYLTYMEVATLALDTFISHGKCTVK